MSTGQHAALGEDAAERALRARGSKGSLPSVHDDESIPPPPGSISGRETPVESYLLERVNVADRKSKQALKLAEAAHSGIGRLEAAFGSSPDPAQGKTGSGMLGVLSELTSQFKSEREDQAKRRQAWANIIKGIAFTLGLVATILGIAKGLLRW